jgi:drug/metabolite transporter (DMT)-like permease
LTTASQTKVNWLHWLVVAALAFTWGSSFLFMKKGLEVFMPFQVAASRISITFLALLPLTIIYLRKVPKHLLKYIAFSGFLGSGFPAFFFATALTKLDSSVGGVLNTLTPVWAITIGIIIFKDRPSFQQIVGIVIGFFGACAIILFNSKKIDFSNLEYASLTIVATFCYGLNINLLKKYLNGVNPLHIAAISFLFIGPFAILYLLNTPFIDQIVQHPKGWQSLGYLTLLGVFGTALASIVFYYLIQKTSTLFAATTTYFIPLVAVLWGILAGEKVGIYHFIGLALILFGVFLVNFKWNKIIKR